MRKRSEVAPETGREAPASELVVQVDSVNEQVILAAALVDDALRKDLVRRLAPECFLTPPHPSAWAALRELDRKNLAYDPAAIRRIAPDVDVNYLASLEQARPDPPSNIEWHVDALLWDKQRATASTGPVASLLEALRDQRAEPERVRALARHVGSSFDGQTGREMLHDTDVLVTQQIADVRQRVAGRALYPFGIRGLDKYDVADEHGQYPPRLLPGAAPGGITIITGVPGGGKSTLACHIALGLGSQGRPVLYGAWEMQGGPTLELMACFILGWSRSKLQTGAGPSGASLTEEELGKLAATMRSVGKTVRFMKNPFRRSVGEKRSNEKNLDLVQNIIADSGCEVFIADLWRRCLVNSKPEEEEEALFRQQAMVEEMRVHAIIVHQQRFKDLEQRPDKRPTREGMKGSGAYVEVADTMIGVHRPSLFKRVDDNTLEVFILKQRYGKWPLGIEFDWNAEYGSIDGGRSIEYDQPGESDLGELTVNGGTFKKPQRDVAGGTRKHRG